uniref:RRM domain-containing protein n=1 Tax=Parascaris univalens TaxID=6257 RepID=A0A914ZRT4_PARUN
MQSSHYLIFPSYTHCEMLSEAYKKADGMKIDGRRVVVDYERGRTQKSWLPRRLGGGKGDTRRTRESKAALEAAALEQGGGHEDRDREHRSSSAHRSYSHDRDSRDRGSERERNGTSSATRRRSRSRERDRDSRRYDEYRSSRDTRNGGDRGVDRAGGDRGGVARDRDYRDDRDRRRY